MVNLKLHEELYHQMWLNMAHNTCGDLRLMFEVGMFHYSYTAQSPGCNSLPSPGFSCGQHHASKHKIHIMPKLFSKMSTELEQTCIFQTIRTELTIPTSLTY